MTGGSMPCCYARIATAAAPADVIRFVRGSTARRTPGRRRRFVRVGRGFSFLTPEPSPFPARRKIRAGLDLGPVLLIGPYRDASLVRASRFGGVYSWIRPRSRNPSAAYTCSAIGVDCRLAIRHPRSRALYSWAAVRAVPSPRRRAVAAVPTL